VERGGGLQRTDGLDARHHNRENTSLIVLTLPHSCWSSPSCCPWRSASWRSRRLPGQGGADLGLVPPGRGDGVPGGAPEMFGVEPICAVLPIVPSLYHELKARARDPHLAHHSDRGVEYLSIRFTERLAQAGIEPSVGSTVTDLPRRDAP
jgi:hypothetical protein